MATKKVQPLDIILGIKGAEKLAALKSSFRELTKTVKQTDVDIEAARKSVNEYVKSANQSEAVIKGQIKAFEGLREQATMGGKVYLELGNQIKQLEADLRGSTDAAEKQRESLVKAGQAAKGSAVDIKSVVSELERLQKSARPGSSAFAQLSKDIAVLKSQLKEANVEVKKFNVGFEIGQRPAMSLEKIQRQIGRLTEGLKGLNFVSNDFLNVQQRIALLGQVQSATIGRQQVIAREQMFSSAAFETFAAGPAGSLQLPKTAAALNLEIGELQERLANTVPGETYANLTVEIANKQRELQRILTGTADAYDKVAAAQDRSTRVAQKLADIQQYQATTPGRIAPGVGGYRDPETGAMIARGRGQIADRAAYRKRGEAFVQYVISAAEGLAAMPALPAAGQTTAPGTGALMSGGARRLTGQVEVTRGAPVAASFSSALAEAARSRQARLPSAAVGVAPAVGFGEQVIKKQVSALREAAAAFRPYNDAIRKARVASNGSISSINNLKNALIAKRNELPATSAAFKRLSKEIEDLDRKSERVSRRMSRRRMSPMQMTQAAGAVLSGGIFGGPEGFIGGAIGALGGVGGAFAGAAIGAQVGGIRRTLGEYTEYAAQIARLKIALEGIAGSQDQYNRALAAAADVTKSLNVPQDVAIQGITRLTAAVKGAGGGVADAELAFKNINAAIIATGGGAEQVEGAVTALVQIFSKGKVSAEEINQIAERLPGTFNKIADASGRTGPELTKALQDGKVGLNDLMKFLVSLGDEYGELAGKIAGSSENAGARLQTAFNQMRIEVGNALQPIGAEFQDAFTEFIKDVTPTLVAVLPEIGQLALGLMKNLTQLAQAASGLASFAVRLAAINLALKGFAALKVPVSTMFILLKSGFRASSQQAALAQGKLIAFGTTVRTLAASLAAPVVITFAVVGAEMVISYFNRIKKAREDLEATAKKPQGDVFFRSIGGTAATKQTLQRNINDITKNLGILRDRVKSTKEEIASYQKTVDAFDPSERAFGLGVPAPDAKDVVPEDLKTRLQADEAEIKRLVLNYRTLVDKYLDAPDEPGRKVFDEPKPNGTGTGTGTGKAVLMSEKELELRNKIRDAMYSENQLKQINAQYELDMLAASREIEDVIKRTNMQEEAAQRKNIALRDLTRQQIEQLVSDLAEEKRLNAEKKVALQEIQLITGEITQEQYDQLKITEQAKELTKLFPDQYDAVRKALEEVNAPLSQFKSRLKEVFEEAMNLKDALADQAVQAVQTLGNTFADFVATGKADFADMTASILRDLSRIFARAALFKGLSLIPGVGSFLGLASKGAVIGGKGGPPTTMPDSVSLMAANGMAFAKNKIVPYAKGGIVGKPTLFKYAEGGSGRFGLMGEAGPEAIMPLRRGRDGKLGVESSGSVGNVVVNVNATGSKVQGDQPNAKALGSAIGAAVQAELIKQKRPGGLLS